MCQDLGESDEAPVGGPHSDIYAKNKVGLLIRGHEVRGTEEVGGSGSS